VAAVSPDAALFSSDFRAPERLFALLMQASGRAGRDAAVSGRSEMWLQTWHPAHPLYAALAHGDYDGFAASQLDERRAAGLPPYAHLALLRAEARTAEAAQDFLDEASERFEALDPRSNAIAYPPVPATISRIADIERMQMMIESPSRAALQHLLARWQVDLFELRARHRGIVRWAIDVDPLSI